MKNAILWTDAPFSSKDRTILSGSTLPIPGLTMFGKHTLRSASPPLPYHYHKDCYEITYISKGVITFSICDTDYSLSGGDVFITKPDEIHSTNLFPLSVGEMYWFQLNTTNLKDFLFLNQDAASYIIKKLDSMSNHKIKTDAKDMRTYMEDCYHLCSSKKDFYMASSYLCLFLHKMWEYSCQIHHHLTADIKNTLGFIENHITEDISLEQLGSLCGLSTSQFKQKFKSQTGVSPRNYINFKKVEAAKKMLQKNRSVTQTAMELSFTSSSYFSVVFKRYTTCTPTEYLLQ